jgi:precorrin-8X/cobalt-precorrin-8 methylmutase
MTPDDIIQESFRRIEQEIGAHGLPAAAWQVVRRMIHASGDLDLVRAVEFRNDAVKKGIEALRDRVELVVDGTMTAAGISKAMLHRLGGGVYCFINNTDVSPDAQPENQTRSASAMTKALARFPHAVYVVGNSPTALLEICTAVRQGSVRPRLLVAMPVGFVNVIESKEQALGLDVPVMAVKGRKGGSAVAAAAVNALMHLALEGP